MRSTRGRDSLRQLATRRRVYVHGFFDRGNGRGDERVRSIHDTRLRTHGSRVCCEIIGKVEVVATLSSLFVTLGLQSNEFLTGIREAQRETKEFEKSIKPLKTALDDAGKAMIGIGAAVSAVGIPFAAMSKAAIDNADALSKMSVRTGLTTETISAINKDPKHADVSIEELGVSLNKQAGAMENAASGNKAAQETFQKLGLNLKDLFALSPDERFFKIAQAIDAVKDPTIKAALAQE